MTRTGNGDDEIRGALRSASPYGREASVEGTAAAWGPGSTEFGEEYEFLAERRSRRGVPATAVTARETGSRYGIAAVNILATVHVVWFYLSAVPCYLNLPKYELGLEKTPFQHRMLMMYPLRWAHDSAWLQQVAQKLTALPAWFPGGVRPEGLVEAPVDVLCVVIAGLVARSLYRAASPRGLLTAYVYPLTLVMVMATYCVNTMHRLRFVFDLPSLGFFSAGMWLIYFRRSRLVFALVFVVGTVNRETTLFLLMLYALTEFAGSREQGRYRRSWRTLGVLVPLALFWVGWRVWVMHHFAGNESIATSRVWLNFGIFLWPTTWPQMLGTFAFCGPVLWFGRRLVRDRTIRTWQWIVLVWMVFMLRYGIYIETRIFGELIPFMACSVALIAEERLVREMDAERISG